MAKMKKTILKVSRIGMNRLKRKQVAKAHARMLEGTRAGVVPNNIKHRLEEIRVKESYDDVQ